MLSTFQRPPLEREERTGRPPRLLRYVVTDGYSNSYLDLKERAEMTPWQLQAVLIRKDGPRRPASEFFKKSQQVQRSQPSTPGAN